MNSEVVGPTYYGLVYKQGSSPEETSFTDAQADALVSEYKAIGLQYQKANMNGVTVIITKAPAAEFKAFAAKKSEAWQEIRERVGYSGNLVVRENCCIPGYADFVPGADWTTIVSFIDSEFGAPSRTKRGGASSGYKPSIGATILLIFFGIGLLGCLADPVMLFVPLPAMAIVLLVDFACHAKKARRTG